MSLDLGTFGTSDPVVADDRDHRPAEVRTVNRVDRSTRVPIAERSLLMRRSPSQWPGFARSSASAGRLLISASGVTCAQATRLLCGGNPVATQRCPQIATRCHSDVMSPTEGGVVDRPHPAEGNSTGPLAPARTFPNRAPPPLIADGDRQPNSTASRAPPRRPTSGDAPTTQFANPQRGEPGDALRTNTDTST